MRSAKTAKILTSFDLAKLGTCTDKTVDFDLSRISYDQLSPLLATLENKGMNELTSISLNFDLLKRTKVHNNTKMASKSETRTSKSRITRPYALEMSAVGRRKNLTRDIANSLHKIISESNSLLKLNLRSIPFTQQDFIQIFQSFPLGHSLRSLHLCDLRLGDEGFEILCRNLKCELINDLQCRKCRLTDLSAPNLKSLISYHVSLQSEMQWKESLRSEENAPRICLTKIDLRDNEFSYNLIRIIHDDILDLRPSLLDLRGNIAITESVISYLQREIPYTEIKTGVSPPERTKKSLKKVQSKPKRVQTKKKKLENENKKLRGLVDTLKRGNEIIEIEPDLAIVGPRANELAEHIKQLDAILSSWEQGPKPFFDAGNNDDDNININEKNIARHKSNQIGAKNAVRKKSVPKKRKNVSDFNPTPTSIETTRRTRRSQSTSRRQNY